MTAAKNSVAVDIACRSDPGRDPEKQVNEDSSSFTETRLGLLAVVCDGMGGHAGGREASQLAVETIRTLVDSAPEGVSPREALKSAIEEANRRVYEMATAERGNRPGSTVVAVLLHTGGAEVAHVGDSRIYLVHAGAVAQITKDHSMVQEMVDRNLIRAEDAAQHPEANKILRALGIAKECEVDLKPETIAFVAGDVFVLCSDGLSDLVLPHEILDIAGSRPAAQAAGQLVDLANARGGHDNVTVMVLRMKESAVFSDARTIVKTVQLTQHLEQPPREHASGPRGTVVEAPAPLVTAPAAPLPGAGVAHVPPAPPLPAGMLAAHHGSSRQERRSLTTVLVASVLTLVAIGIAGGIVWTTTMRRTHVTVPLIDAGHANSDAASEEDAASPVVTPAPTLPEPAASAGRASREDGGAGRAPELADCDRARAAKAKGAPAAVVLRLEDKCRAAGGIP